MSTPQSPAQPQLTPTPSDQPSPTVPNADRILLQLVDDQYAVLSELNGRATALDPDSGQVIETLPLNAGEVNLDRRTLAGARAVRITAAIPGRGELLLVDATPPEKLDSRMLPIASLVPEAPRCRKPGALNPAWDDPERPACFQGIETLGCEIRRAIDAVTRAADPLEQTLGQVPSPDPSALCLLSRADLKRRRQAIGTLVRPLQSSTVGLDHAQHCLAETTAWLLARPCTTPGCNGATDRVATAFLAAETDQLEGAITEARTRIERITLARQHLDRILALHQRGCPLR